ncbi:efflux RND transporter permease subunit [Kitasatospora sp. MAP5-34]|uniref:efflux RND transporter permease subunit n=1 Tax=Kitasatospora sp. MAP5-34 TaxID=3035102 RepID=UPI002474CD95|nr:efflux RND transporter permease subunit [Kitasatospora sp. MAP5-34]
MRLAAAMAAAALVVLFLGTAVLRHAPVDTLPEFLPPHVQVQTEALGLSANEVEQLITVPLEDEFNGLAFLDHLRSQSRPGLSAIDLTFKPGTDIYQARQLVTERVAQGPAVVAVGTPPVMIQPLSAQSRAMMVGLSSKSVSMIDLSTLARWRIRPRLLAVPGVANVTIWGQRDQQLQVLVDPARMHQQGVTLTQVINTTGDAMWTSPLSFVEASSPGADGFIDTPNQRLSVQHIQPIGTPKDLASVPLEETADKKVLLGDVATVVVDHPPLRGDAVLPGGPGFLLVVEKFPGADTLAVAKGVEAAMADLRPGLSGVAVDTSVFRPATFIETALRHVGWAALAGLLLLVGWLGVCWRSWRVALIALVGVALPLVAAADVLYLSGATFTTMTLAGLVVALGVVVDDTVRTVAAIRHRLAEPDEPGAVRSRSALIAEAVPAVRRPLGFALVVIVLAVVPLLLLGGLAGALTRPMVTAYLLAVLAATLVAMTVTPALAYLLLRTAPPRREVPRPVRRAERLLGRAQLRFVRGRGWVFGSVALLAVCGLAVLPQLGTGALIPQTQDRNLLVRWQAAPGTSLPAMEQATSAAADTLRAVPGVTGVASDLGQALMGDQMVDVDSSQTWITLAPNADYGATRAAVQQRLDAAPGLRHTLLTYPQAALDAGRTRTGPALSVRLYGTDQQVLATQAERIRQSLAALPGVAGAQVQLPTMVPSIKIETNIDAAAAHGLKPGDIRRATAVLLAGIPVGSYYQQQQIFDVSVWSVPANRQNLSDIQNLLLDAPNGQQVALKDVATVSVQPTATQVDHDQVSRYLDITAAVQGTDLGPVVDRARTGVQALGLPLGYHAEVSSDLAGRQSDDLRTLLYVLASAAGILLLLQAALGGWGRAALLFLTLPLSAAGGALTALAAGRFMTAGALIGFVAVLGLAVRGGILHLRNIRRLEQLHPESPRLDLVLRATKEVAVPALVTAVGLALAVLPFVVRGDIAGMEVVRPLALVVLGGLLTSLLVTWFVLPGLYLRLIPRPAAGAA